MDKTPKRGQSGARLLPLPQILEVLSARARLKDGKLTPWSEVADETHHSLTKVYEAWRWFLSRPWDEVKTFPEEVRRLRSDYLEMKARGLEGLRPPRRDTLYEQGLRKAISLWIEKQQPASDQEIASLSSGKVSAWGVVADVTTEGQVRSRLAIGHGHAARRACHRPQSLLCANHI